MLRPEGETYTNPVGLRFVRIEPGTFTMGIGQTPLSSEITDNKAQGESWKPNERPYLQNGDFDEYPPHQVTISQPFYMGITTVTNTQYEQFDPSHRKFRGKLGFSKTDDEAAIFVNWYEAVGFCQWMSAIDGFKYRLPTEAEWEYACRAGTTTHFHTGDTLPESFHKNPNESWYPSVGRGGSMKEEVIPLTVGQTSPNPWGLHDMHGNVEEWCQDWYAEYPNHAVVDPTGPPSGSRRARRATRPSVCGGGRRSCRRSATGSSRAARAG